MWMVGGYNESSHHHHHHHQVNLGSHDAFNGGGRKLRPLIPRPPAAAVVSSTSCAANTHSCNFSLYTGSDIFSLNHHLGFGGDQGSNKNKDELNINNGAPQVVMSTSRWNPTPDQLRTLEDLYRRGTRTPSTEQIQRITAELRRYGKIEGKNVFYWFQNHKARERQKRRRELELLSHDHNHHDPIIERKERGPANGKQGFEGEQTRSYCSIIGSDAAIEEESRAVSMQRAAAKGGRRSDAATVSHLTTRHNIGRLFHLDDQRNATWHNLHRSSYSTGPATTPSIVTCNINNNNNNNSITPPPSILDGATGPETRRFITSLKTPIPDTTKGLYEVDDDEDGGEGEGSTTLQLFPLRSEVESEQDEDDGDKLKERDVHFFEFLPPKIN